MSTGFEGPGRPLRDADRSPARTAQSDDRSPQRPTQTTLVSAHGGQMLREETPSGERRRQSREPRSKPPADRASRAEECSWPVVRSRERRDIGTPLAHLISMTTAEHPQCCPHCVAPRGLTSPQASTTELSLRSSWGRRRRSRRLPFGCLELKSRAGWDHWREAGVDRVDDLGSIDALQVGAGYAQMGMT